MIWYLKLPYDCTDWVLEKRIAMHAMVETLLHEAGCTYKNGVLEVSSDTGNLVSAKRLVVSIPCPDAAPEKVCEILSPESFEKAFARWQEEQERAQAVEEARQAEAAKVLLDTADGWVGCSADEVEKRMLDEGASKPAARLARRLRAHEIVQGLQ